MHVRERMTTLPGRCNSRDRLDQVLDQMAELDCAWLPVVDDRQRMIGVVGLREVCMAASIFQKDPEQLRVLDAMANRLPACRPDDEMDRAFERMNELHLKRLAVVDQDGRLLGMLPLEMAQSPKRLGPSPSRRKSAAAA